MVLRGLARLGSNGRRGLHRVDLRQHFRQFALQIHFGLLVIGVRQLAQAKLKLQVAQVFVDLRLALFQVRGGRYRREPRACPGSARTE